MNRTIWGIWCGSSWYGHGLWPSGAIAFPTKRAAILCPKVTLRGHETWEIRPLDFAYKGKTTTKKKPTAEQPPAWTRTFSGPMQAAIKANNKTTTKARVRKGKP